MNEAQLQTITVDSEAQAVWQGTVMKAHSEVALFAVDAAGRDHALIKMSPAGVTCAKFEGEATSLKLELANENRQISWALNLCPTESLHVRADVRGQLEVWSGTAPVAKWFDADASLDDWPPGLIHATAGRVRALSALLTNPVAVSLRSLGLGGTNPLADLSPLAGLAQLMSLNLSACEKLTDISPLAGLNQLTSLDLSRCKQLTDISPLAGLTQLTSLDLSSCELLIDLLPLAGLTQLTSLDLSACDELTDLSPLAGLTLLTSLDLAFCQQLTELSPLAAVTQLTSLNLMMCIQLTNSSPLAGLTQLTSLVLDSCRQLTDFSPLASLTQLTSLNLGDCRQLTDLSPLAGLTQLTSLNLDACRQLTDLSPLAGLTRLTSLELRSCERLVNIAPIACLPVLTKLDIAICANIRDVDILVGAPALKSLSYSETSTRDSVLLTCAVRRGDARLADLTATVASSFFLSKFPEIHACRLVKAVEKLVTSDTDLTEIFSAVASAFRKRGEVPLKTWEKFLGTVIRAPGTASRLAFEVTLAALPLAETERVLGPALLALAETPASARAWALGLAQRALAPVAASASHARDVAPAAAVFFHAQGLTADVEAWMERGSVVQVPAWRDRVLVALLGRALRMSEVLEARRLLGLMHTPERRDEGLGLLAQHLAALAQFRDAASELDAIVDRARRASTAAQALAETPAFAGDPHAGLSLLLALDGDPGTQADVLAAMVQQLPDSELVRHVAAVFAPTQGVDLGRAVDALLSHEAVTARTKPKLLAGLRSRVSADRNFVHAVLVHGTAHLLVAEGLVDDDEAAQLSTDLLDVKP